MELSEREGIFPEILLTTVPSVVSAMAGSHEALKVLDYFEVEIYDE
jgi:hypothetical protein